MRKMSALIITSLFFLSAAAAANTTAAVYPSFDQIHEFTLHKSILDNNTKSTPLLEGNLVFQDSPPEQIKNIHADLSEIKYASVPLTPNSKLIGLQGTDMDGNTVYFFDRDHDLDLSDEVAAEFITEENIQVARIPIRYSVRLGANEIQKETELSLYERSPGRIEYHFNELWEATLSMGGETLQVALQRWPILFIDNNYSGSYDKIFSTDREVLALGGKFFRVRPDFVMEKIILEETDRSPVDQGFSAPDFDVSIRDSDKTFNLGDNRDGLTVLNFWSPLCSGSRAQAASYSRLAEEFEHASSVNFLAVTYDEAALNEYLKDNSHHFLHAVDPELWDLYGVTAPFVTFLIDADGMILKRYFQYSPAIREGIERWLKIEHSNGDEDPNEPSQDLRGQKAYVFYDRSYAFEDISADEQDSSVKVYFLGTCGFFITGGGKNILVDALYKHPRIEIVRTPDEVLGKMLRREPPFQHVDLVLVSHNHADHFTTDVAFPFLEAHPETRLVANRHTLSLASEQNPVGYEKVREQIVEQTPSWGTIQKVEINGVPLQTYIVSHSTDARPVEREYNVSHFLIELEGLRILHMGDIYHDANIPYFKKIGFQDKHIDIVFAETWDYEAGQTVMNELIKPKLYVAMHNRFGDDKLRLRMLKTFPHTIGFTTPMEMKIFLFRDRTTISGSDHEILLNTIDLTS